MDIASALLLKNNLTRKSSTPLSITGGRNERKEKKRNQNYCQIHNIYSYCCLMTLVPDVQ